MPRLLERPAAGRAVTPEATAHAALAAARGGEAVAEVVAVVAHGDGMRAGRRMLVWAERTAGTLGDPEVDREAVRLAREALRDGTASGTREVAVDGRECTLFLECHRPPPELVIVGAGHIARPLCRLGAMLGYRVTVLDDRPDFATRDRFPDAARVVRARFDDPFETLAVGPSSHLVLVTRGHKFDYDVLLALLRLPVEVAYIGMVGSRRRVRAALQALAEEGIDRARLGRIHAPIGLDVGAETPEEIAVAIAAELVRTRRGGTGLPLRDRARVVERWVGNDTDE